jgi:SMODS and SLOG-associating 2TM effector domain family 4
VPESRRWVNKENNNLDGNDVNEGNAADDVGELVERYRIRAHRYARGHYLASKRDAAMHTRLGVPAVALSAIVGSSIFATISSSPAAVWVVLAGLASVLAAVLAALQTFFGFSERAGKHRVAGAEFASLKRDLDLLALKCRGSGSPRDSAVEELKALTSRFNQLQTESPDVPDRFYDRARNEQANDVEGI